MQRNGCSGATGTSARVERNTHTVSEQGVDHTDVRARFDHMGGEAVVQGVARRTSIGRGQCSVVAISSAAVDGNLIAPRSTFLTRRASAFHRVDAIKNLGNKSKRWRDVFDQSDDVATRHDVGEMNGARRAKHTLIAKMAPKKKPGVINARYS